MHDYSIYERSINGNKKWISNKYLFCAITKLIFIINKKELKQVDRLSRLGTEEYQREHNMA